MSDETRQQAIEDAMTSPASASTDGTSATARTVDELIKADKYLAAKGAADRPHRGLRFTRIIPGGAG
jgi:hypothetical protein